MVVVDGFIGNDPEYRSRARLYIESANANIAGMQQQLYFPPDRLAADWEPELVDDLHPQPGRCPATPMTGSSPSTSRPA